MKATRRQRERGGGDDGGEHRQEDWLDENSFRDGASIPKESSAQFVVLVVSVIKLLSAVVSAVFVVLALVKGEGEGDDEGAGKGRRCGR